MSPEAADRHDARELLGPYALGALDAEERTAVEQLVAADPAARAELRGYEQAVAALPLDDRPSPQVWDRIREALDEDDGAVAPIEPLRRSGRRSAVRLALLAAAAALVALVAWGAVHLANQAAPSRPISDVQRAADQAGTVRGARRLTVTSPDHRTVVRVVILPDGRGYVLGGTIPQAGSARTYALFATSAGRPVLVAVLGTVLHVVEFHVPLNTSGLAVGQTTGPGAPVLAVGSAPLGAVCRSCPPSPAPPAPTPASPSGGAPIPTPSPVAPTVPTTTVTGLPPVTLPILPPLPIHLP